MNFRSYLRFLVKKATSFEQLHGPHIQNEVYGRQYDSSFGPLIKPYWRLSDYIYHEFLKPNDNVRVLDLMGTGYTVLNYFEYLSQYRGIPSEHMFCAGVALSDPRKFNSSKLREINSMLNSWNTPIIEGDCFDPLTVGKVLEETNGQFDIIFCRPVGPFHMCSNTQGVRGKSPEAITFFIEAALSWSSLLAPYGIFLTEVPEGFFVNYKTQQREMLSPSVCEIVRGTFLEQGFLFEMSVDSILNQVNHHPVASIRRIK